MPPERRYEILVIGGGPAGMAAAWSAATCGRRVAVLDDNPAWGGQLWRGEAARPTSREAAAWFHNVAGAGVAFLPGARVFAQPEPGRLWAETADGRMDLTYDRLILATGARERFLPFPGWTLPNVMGAGGLQALVKTGLPIRGKKVIVAGSGPLLLAVAAYLHKKGAVICLITEQAPLRRLLRFGLTLLGRPDKLLQAVGLKLGLGSTPYRAGCWPVSAQGHGKLDAVTLTDGQRTWTTPCDYLACGFGLVPNTELAQLLGCTVRDGAVQVGERQETTVPGVYCAGEAAGVGGLDAALVEGRIAGCAAAGRDDTARRLVPQRRKARRFAAALETAFALRDELKDLPRPETMVCRCEDVTLGQLRRYDSWRAAKLQTRCGMGPCQGRVCGPALAFLRGWQPDGVRPPLVPVRLESLIGAEKSDSVEMG